METILTEKMVNNCFYPVTYKLNNKLKYSDFIIYEGSKWDLNCYNLVDILSTKIRKKFENSIKRLWNASINGPYDSRLPPYFPLCSQPERIKQLEPDYEDKDNPDVKELKHSCNLKISIPITEISNSIPFKHSNNNVIRKTIEIISTCLMRVICRVNIQLQNKKNFTFQHKYQMKTPTTLFKYEYIEGIEGKDKRYYGSKYRFIFDGVLGSIFINNIGTGAYNLIEFPEDFYNLSKYANLLFRKFLLHLDHTPVINLERDIVLSYIGIYDKEPYQQKRRFKLIIEELQDLKFINICWNEKISKFPSYYKVNRIKKSDREKLIDDLVDPFSVNHL